MFYDYCRKKWVFADHEGEPCSSFNGEKDLMHMS